jgi:hypothetical protein
MPIKVNPIKRSEITNYKIFQLLTRLDRESSSCWLWKGKVRADGYVQTTLNGRDVLIHRLLYTYYRGDIPEGIFPDHTCKIRHCANPWHLDPVTIAVNIRRADRTNVAKRLTKDFCHLGHPLTESNLYWMMFKGKPRRHCKTCHKAAQSKYYYSKKAS